jgi:hypothetical protein
MRLSALNIGAGATTGTAAVYVDGALHHVGVNLDDFEGVGFGSLGGATGTAQQSAGWRASFFSFLRTSFGHDD